MRYEHVQKALRKLANPEKAKILQRFFKTGKGEYGEGDVFLGVTVPLQRTVARKFRELPLPDIGKLLQSRVHEHRFTALEILVMQFERGGEAERGRIFKFYLKNAKCINNWDLVDTSAPYIVGVYLLNKPKHTLYKLAGSRNVWERRIAIVGTLGLIQAGVLKETFAIAQTLLSDKHDLIHKAAGWMLREAGKKDASALYAFLNSHGTAMPRTMLRYAIEKLPEAVRKQYMAK